MEAKNLNKKDVKELDAKMHELFQENKDLSWRFFNQDEELKDIGSPDEPNQIRLLLDKIDALNRKIDLIFGKAVLMNGRWVDIGNKKGE